MVDIKHPKSALFMVVLFLVPQNANVDIQTEAITPAIEADVEQGDVPEKANGMDVRTDLVDKRIYSRLIGNTFASVSGLWVAWQPHVLK